MSNPHHRASGTRRIVLARVGAHRRLRADGGTPTGTRDPSPGRGPGRRRHLNASDTLPVGAAAAADAGRWSPAGRGRASR